MLKNCLILFTGIIFSLFGFSQETRRYSFTHYSVNNGLAAYHVNEVIQDEQGFMWIATIDGLQRFDGNRFLTFRHSKNDKNSIPDNQVFQLLIDSKKNLWLVTADGSVGIFDTKRMIYKKAEIKAKKEKNPRARRTLSLDSKGNLIYTFIFSEILIYNYNTNEFSPQNIIFKTPPLWKVMSVLEDRAGGKYWLSTDSGLAVYNVKTNNISYSGHNTDKEPVIEKFGNLYHAANLLVDSKQRLWFHHWPNNAGAPFLYCYDLKNNKVVLEKYDFMPLLKTYIEPGGMIEQKDGTIWMSGLGIFMKYLEKEKTFELVSNIFLNEQSISYKIVHKLFEDREHNIWVPTSNNGLYVFNPAEQLFTSIKHINRELNKQGGGGVMSFAQTGSGDILVGTWGDGIYRYDANMKLKPLAIKGLNEKNNNSAWGMHRLSDKRHIWMSLQPGILVYDELTNSARVYNPPIFQNRTNRQVMEDKIGNIWIGSHSLGVFKWIPSLAKNKFEDGFIKYERIPNTLVEKIEKDSKGFIWICTSNQGVYKIDPVSDSIVDHITTGGPPEKKLMADGAAAALEYNDSIMIIVTGGLNIYNTKANKIIHIGTTEGLPSNIVMSIAKDKDGFLWLGMFNGLCKMSIEKWTFTYYDRNDGMLNDNFDLAAAYRLPDGRMLFGTSDDFIVFDPAKVKSDLRPPDVTITDFRVVNKPVLVDSILNLKHVELLDDENSITIGFAGMSYFSRNKLTYHYKMEGIEKDWRKSNILNQAVYNYLPPGEYTFKVRAENGDGARSNVTVIRIKVKPPFWQTPWFIGIIAFISLAVLYWIDKFRMERIIDNQRTRSSIAGSLSKDMSSTLSSINILSEMAKLKAGTDIERTKDYVSQISENSNRMIEVMEDMVWSINPENDGMQNIIDRMKKYAAEIQLRHNIEISFNADPALLNKRLVMDRRHELFLIYKEALVNIGKHSNSRFADIDIHCVKSKMILQVMDDGKGFDTESVIYGRGLNEMRKRAAALNAKLDISSKVNNGTVIRIEIVI